MFVYLYRKHKARQQQKSNQPDNTSTKKKVQPCAHQVSATSPSNSPNNKCEVCAAQKREARRYRWKLLLLLLPGFFIASLDLTVVASSLPFIASHFNKFNQLNWIVTAFTLTNTAFIPVFGQLADTFGRHATLQLATFLLIIGSVLCAAAPVWAVLLLGRALQGIGTAGIQNVALIALADRVSLKEQAVNTSIFQLLNGIGYSVGPVIGGYLTNSNWRYIFVLGLGMGVVSMIGIFFLRTQLKPGSVSIYRPPPGQTRLQAIGSGFSTLDVGGIFFFVAGVSLVILGTSWGGSTFPWSSAGVIAPLVIGAVLLLAFIVWEKFLEPGSTLARRFPKTRALIPFHILGQKDVGLVCCVAAATGAALFSVFYFIGIYFTLVEGDKASKSGTQLLYYVPGLGAGAYFAMFFCNAWPRQTFWPLFLGTIVETAGIATLTYAVKARQSTLVNVMMAISGAGTGVRMMPSSLHLAGMFRDRLAAVYSLLRFTLPFGGTLALTIMGAVFQNQMAVFFGSPEVQNAGGSTHLDLHNTGGLDAVNKLSPDQQKAIRSKAADATMWAFVSILPILGLSVLATLFLGNVWISKKKKKVEAAVVDDGGVVEEGEEGKEKEAVAATTVREGERSEILTDNYLAALFTGTVKAKKRLGPTDSRAAEVGS